MLSTGWWKVVGRSVIWLAKEASLSRSSTLYCMCDSFTEESHSLVRYLGHRQGATTCEEVTT